SRPLLSSRVAVAGSRTGTSWDSDALPISPMDAGATANSTAVPIIASALMPVSFVGSGGLLLYRSWKGPGAIGPWYYDHWAGSAGFSAEVAGPRLPAVATGATSLPRKASHAPHQQPHRQRHQQPPGTTSALP